MKRYKVKNKINNKVFVVNAINLTHLTEILEKITIGYVTYEISLLTVRKGNNKPRIQNIIITGQ